MITSLYIMTLCFCAYVLMQSCNLEKESLIVFSVGIAFFWIANACYDRTITKFKNEIRDLNKKIDNLKK